MKHRRNVNAAIDEIMLSKELNPDEKREKLRAHPARRLQNRRLIQGDTRTTGAVAGRPGSHPSNPSNAAEFRANDENS
jgi:hypothetical protein